MQSNDFLHVTSFYADDHFNFTPRPFEITYREARVADYYQKFYKKLNDEQYRLHNDNLRLTLNQSKPQITISRPNLTHNTRHLVRLHHYKSKYQQR